jgi:hypothetical protein
MNDERWEEALPPRSGVITALGAQAPSELHESTLKGRCKMFAAASHGTQDDEALNRLAAGKDAR